MRTLIILTLFFLFAAAKLPGQNLEIDRLMESELKMTFPGIYFKNNSTEYAGMPYSVDSCLKYIVSYFDENINSLVIWRDTAETEALTIKRIKKLKSALKKHLPNKEFEIYSMGDEQKISRYTILKTTDSLKAKYLLTLNSVFDISKTRRPLSQIKSHILKPRLFCWGCFKHLYHIDKNSRNLRKAVKRNKKSLYNQKN